MNKKNQSKSNNKNCLPKKSCEKIKREKHKIDKNLQPIANVLIQMPEFKNK